MGGNNQIDAKIRIGAQVDQALAEVAKLRKEMKALGGDAKPDLSAIKEEVAAKRQAAQEAAAAAKAEAQAKRQAAQEAVAAARTEAAAKRQAAQATAQQAREDAARAARVATSARAITQAYQQAAQESSKVLATSAREAQAAYDRAAENAFLAWRDSLARIRRESSSQSLTLSPVASAARVSAGGEDLTATTGRVQQLKGQLVEVRNLLATLFAVQVGGDALLQVTRLVDAYNGMVNRLRVATQSQKEFDAALQLTRGVATTYSQSLTNVGRLVERIYSSIKPLGGTLDNAAVLVEGLSASLRLSGATAEEAASAILQYSQALGRGVLNGDEFRAVFESAPRLIYALAEALGKSTGELKKMGEEGRLTTSVILEGLNKALPQLRAQAAQVAPTIGEAFTAVGNSFQEYLGKSENVRVATTLLIDGLNSLAQNIGPLVEAITALGVVLATVFVGRMAAATVAVVEAAAKQLILAAAARAVAAEMGIASLATTGMTASLAGPVGLIAAVGALTFAWIKLEKARQDARNATVDGLEEQRGEVQAELDDLNERTTAFQKQQAVYAQSRKQLQDQLDEFDRRIDDKRREQAQQDFRSSENAARSNPVGADGLRDTAAVEAFERQYRTRNAIVKKYESERADYVKAKDKEIAAARSAGDGSELARLESEKSDFLAAQEAARQRELANIAQQGAATRISQAQQLYDKELQLQIDAAERGRRVAQEQLDAGLLDFTAYFERRAQLEQRQSDLEIEVLQRQLKEQRANLARNIELRKNAATPNEQQALQQSILADTQRINQLETEITKKKRDQVDQARTLATETARVTQAIDDQLAALDEQIARSKGFLTDDQIAASAARQVKAISDALAKLGVPAEEIMARVTDLTSLKTVEAQLAQLRQQYQLAADQLSTAEQNVANARNSGAITAQEAEARILQLRRDQLPVLDALLERLRAVASSPEQKAEIEKISANLGSLRDLRTDLQKTAEQQLADAGGSVIKGLATQSESAVDVVRNALRKMAEAALDLISQQLGQQIAKSFLPQAGAAAAGGGNIFGSIGSFFASLFHAGGVVGSGSAQGRMLPASAFTFAPRYHTGGLAADEVPAVLRKGEEVLTADDPRHVRNFRGGGVNVSITTNVEAAGGTAQANQAAGDQLGQQVRAVVDQWAIEQSRPGGILSGS